MEKTIIIGSQNVRLKSTGATPLRYKAQFRRDFIADIMKMSEMQKLQSGNVEDVDFDRVDFDVIYNIVWVMAKTADNTIPEPIEWLDTFESFPIMEIFKDAEELIMSSIQTKKN